jgi:hypothetical protein
LLIPMPFEAVRPVGAILYKLNTKAGRVKNEKY